MHHSQSSKHGVSFIFAKSIASTEVALEKLQFVITKRFTFTRFSSIAPHKLSCSFQILQRCIQK